MLIKNTVVKTVRRKYIRLGVIKPDRDFLP
jgi:hypothetical protein